MNRRAPPRWLLLSVAIAMNLVWALSYPISKTLVEELSPLAIASTRMLGAAILLAPLLRRRDFPRNITVGECALVAAMGLLGCGAPALLQYVGTARSTPANVAMIVSLEPSSVALLSALVLKDAFERRKLVALVVALVGVTIITVDPASLSLLASDHLAGNVILLGSIFFYSSYTVAAKHLSRRWGVSALTVLPFVVAGLVMFPTMAVLRPEEMHKLAHLSKSSMVGLTFTVVMATAAGYIVWNWLLGFLSTTEVALSLYIQPVAGALLSWWMIGEKLAAHFIAGSCLILVALAVGQPARAD